MQCRHCHSAMQATDSVTDAHARQTWYRCPLCAAAQTISQPHEAELRRIGDRQRCSHPGPLPQRTRRDLY